MATGKVGLTKEAIQDAAERLSVPTAAIQAVTFVESSGSGFLPSGHPKVLFERHKMFKWLRVKYGVTKASAISANFPLLVNTKPGGYSKPMDEPARLERAAGIDRDIALQSSSWGLFQILGEHWDDMGYASLQEFINAMFRDEAAHLDAFVRFILADPRLGKCLRALDWAGFAEIYNGPNYRKGRYDTKLAAAFKRFSDMQL